MLDWASKLLVVASVPVSKLAVVDPARYKNQLDIAWRIKAPF
jgi:hypothetical protein